MRRLISAIVVACVAALSWPGDAGAATRVRERGSETVLVMSGAIGPGAYKQFRRLIDRGRPGLVVLEGPGGVLGEALLIADEIHSRRINTLVGPDRTCASACAVIFLSGRSKYVGRGATVGLHAARYRDGRRSAEGTGIMADYLGQVGVPRGILRRMERTAPNSITWLSRSELKAMRIRTVDPRELLAELTPGEQRKAPKRRASRP